MKLYVMRHGPAEEQSADERDGTRALTPSGRVRCRAVAQRLGELGEHPITIVSSPLVRAVQTAELVAQHVSSIDMVSAHSSLAPGALGLAFVYEQLQAGRKRLMIVGHEPDLSTLVGRLLGQPMPSGFMKAMVVGLKVIDPTTPTTLRFVLDPKALSLLVDQR